MYKNEELRRPIHREMSGRFAGLQVKPNGVFGINDMGYAEDFVFAVVPDRHIEKQTKRIVREFHTDSGAVLIEFDPVMVKSDQITQALKKL